MPQPYCVVRVKLFRKLYREAKKCLLFVSCAASESFGSFTVRLVARLERILRSRGVPGASSSRGSRRVSSFH
jgi:hypothetical protein